MKIIDKIGVVGAGQMGNGIAHVAAQAGMKVVLHDLKAGRTGELETALRTIAEEGRGVVVLIRDTWNTSFSNQVRLRHDLPPAKDKSVPPPPLAALRDYGVGAQILVDLGVSEMRLLTNATRTIPGIDGYGLKVVERLPLGALEELSDDGGHS